MARLENSLVTNKSHLHQRITASLTVQASWVETESGETVFVNGLTENLGESSALVNLEVLPPVGSEVNLRVYDEEKTIIEVPTHVIRVQRDPSRMLASLSITDKQEKWQENALPAAEDWATRHWQLNYDEEWVN
jgi:hypothetical protein